MREEELVEPVEREGDEPRFIAIKKIMKHGGDTPNNNLSDEKSWQLDKRSRQVQLEIWTVGHIRHRNLLPLAAHVPRMDYHFLVRNVDFAPKGTCPHARVPLDMRVSPYAHPTVSRMRAYALRGKISAYEYMKNCGFTTC